MILSINDLVKILDTTIKGLERYIYKYTECGAWVEIIDNGIRLGSIVEKSNAITKTYTLKYPFEISTLWCILELIEEETDILWHEAND